MPVHHFISYSTIDALDFALRLCDALAAGPPSFSLWLDKRQLRPGEDWDEQLAEAIRACESIIFVMTRDSVQPACTCKQEWTRGLKYKKPVIPIRLHADAELPFRLEPRQFIDFTSNFETGLARLRNHLQWLASPAGALQALKYRLADAQRDLQREQDPQQRTRIQDDVAQLEKQIAEQQRVVDDPQAAAERVAASIAAGLEREREPQKPISGEARTKFINPPPMTAPSYFQDRHVETRLIADFLRDESRRVLTLVGRGGTGKTALACRLLKALEQGHLPDDLGSLAVDGIVYLSAVGSRRVQVPDLYADLLKLLPEETARHLDSLYKNPHADTDAKMRTLLAAFPHGRIVVLLDNFEDVVDAETLSLRDAELEEALTALLQAPAHAIKVIITTRVAPRSLALVQPARQTRLDLDEGLASPFAENILREMDVDGKVGLQTASDDLLSAARARTRGFPRALEALFAILSADRDTTLQEILDNAANRSAVFQTADKMSALLPENVVRDLVGEAFDRLDLTAQKVMQALAIYGRPVTPTAVDYLLQPVLTGVNSAPVLSRLVNMHFVRKEAGRYYLHPVDREYALSRVPHGAAGDREVLDDKTPFTQIALADRGANYFAETRLPRENWKTLADLAPQLAEIDLRCAAEDYDTAVTVLTDIDGEYLHLWGHYRLMIDLHENLQGKLNDPDLKSTSLGNLGTAYRNIGQMQRAISCYEQALAIERELENQQGEGAWLGNLGNCYLVLGQTARAIDYYEQVLAIGRKIGDRHNEGGRLGNLGICYAILGQTGRGIEFCEQALIIAREFGYKRLEDVNLENMGRCYIDQGKWDVAIQAFNQALQISDEIGEFLTQNEARHGLALAYLYSNNLIASHTAIEAARQFDYPPNNHNVFALLGVIALRQADRPAAQEAFVAAVQQAEQLLAHSAQNYAALDSKGLALSGLALCEGPQHVAAAIAAYRAARAINKDAGIVGRVLRLFDELAKADSTRILKEVRAAAAGG